MQEGSSVVVMEAIFYRDKRPLKPGFEGVVNEIDEAGDALISFDAEGVHWNGWVLKRDFGKLQVQTKVMLRHACHPRSPPSETTRHSFC